MEIRAQKFHPQVDNCPSNINSAPLCRIEFPLTFLKHIGNVCSY